MRVEERIEQMLLLCKFSGWSLDEFKKQLAERYPHGPHPTGHGWNWDRVESAYTELMADD